MTGPHLVTTPAAPALCHRCRRLILSGLVEGLSARVDVEALDQAREVEALLSGRDTYTFTAAAELVYRDASRIAGGLRGVILAAHTCTTPDTDRPPF